jgi:hypothetical protein
MVGLALCGAVGGAVTVFLCCSFVSLGYRGSMDAARFREVVQLNGILTTYSHNAHVRKIQCHLQKAMREYNINIIDLCAFLWRLVKCQRITPLLPRFLKKVNAYPMLSMMHSD